MDIKKIFLLKLIVLSSIIFVNAQESQAIEDKANELTRWMKSNLELSVKQLAAVKELNYELIQRTSQERSSDSAKEIIEIMEQVLTDEQMILFLREREEITIR